MKKIFLDTNIFIDILSKRNTGILTKDELSHLIDNYKIYISALTVHITYYVGKIKPEAGKHESMKKLLKLINIIPLSEDIISLSINNFHADFEDTLQYYSALDNNCNYILTRDKKDFAKIKKNIPSKIQIISSLRIKEVESKDIKS